MRHSATKIAPRIAPRFASMLAALLVVLGALGLRTADAAPRLVPAAQVGRITVLAEPGLEAIAHAMADSAERTLARIASDLMDLPTPRAIEVHLVRDAADLPAVAPAGRGAPAWAIGVAYPDLGVISVAMHRGANYEDPQTTLRHELAHIALGASLGDRAPHWLHEGFAYQHSGEWSWERVETLAGMAWTGGVIELEQLDRTFPREEQPAHRAYAESYDFVGFLSRRGRWDDISDDGDRWPFRRFLRAVGQGSDLDIAAVHAFGKPIHALFDEWRNDLGNRYLLVPIGLFGLLVWILCALLLSLAWWRRRGQNRRRLALWDLEDQRRREAEAAAAQAVAPPPYIAWPGDDPVTAEPQDPSDDDEPRRDPPRWIN